MVAEFIQTNIHLQDDEYYYGPCRHVSYRKLAIVRVINVCQFCLGYRYVSRKLK